MTKRTQTSLAGRLSLVAAFAACACIAPAQPTAVHPRPELPAATAITPATRSTAAPAQAQTAPTDKESSLTVQQIVARQEDHYATIKNAQGIAVHSETRYNDQAQPQQPVLQYIFFAYEDDKSVTLAMPDSAAQIYRGSQGQIPWSQITSAFHVAGDAVYVIRKGDASTTTPAVMAIPYNPAVHENNPLVSFHIRQISDEQMPLRDLARAIPNMPQRPKVYDVVQQGKPLLRIQFSNPATPGELLDYMIDPARGYLPVQIVRSSNGRAISVSVITIGNTPDGTWVPAKRERLMYANGKVASRQLWHFDYLAINKKLPPKALSLMYFNLPLTTPVHVVESASGVTSGTRQNQVPKANSSQRQAPQRIATPTPIPPRIAPAPVRVPL